jgi:uncharacterized protein YwgA
MNDSERGMNRLQRAAVLTSLADELLKRGSWCGETHLQKSIYLLQEALGVPIDVNYVFYKHGPYSFDLHDELTSLRADGLLKMVSQPYPYGPKLIPTDEAEQLEGKFPRTLKKYSDEVSAVADFVGAASASLLERLSTALYVMKEEGLDGDKAADRVTALKPHVPIEQAKDAVLQMKHLA